MIGVIVIVMCVMRYTMRDLEHFKLVKRNQNLMINLALRNYQIRKCPFCGQVGWHSVASCRKASADWEQ